MAKIINPLTICLRDVKIDHTFEFIKCFETSKNLLTNDLIVQYPDFSNHFTVTTDASNFAIQYAISFHKHTGLLEPFRPYLACRKFEGVTDHMPTIREHSYEIIYKKYIPRKQNRG